MPFTGLSERHYRCGAFFFAGAGWLHAGYTVQNPVPVATWWLHGLEKEKPRYQFDSGVSLCTGGEGGIRTHGDIATTPDFESGTFDHSATSPMCRSLRF